MILSMLAILQLSWFCLCLQNVSCHDSVCACYTSAVMIMSMQAIRQLSWLCLCWLYVSCHDPVYACYTSAVTILFMFAIHQLSWFCLWLLHQPWFCLFLLRLYCHELCNSQPSADDFLCFCPTRTTLTDHFGMYRCWHCSSLLWCDITLLSLFGLDLVFFAKLTEGAEFFGNKCEEIGNSRSGREKKKKKISE